jgi:hypothetical protein
MAEDILGFLALDNLSLIHHRNPVADRCDRQKIMRDEENSHAKFVAKCREQLQYLGLCIDVESASWFIGNEESRAVQDSHCDEDSLGLANA